MNCDCQLIWETFEKLRIKQLYSYGYRPHPTKEGVVVRYSNSKFGEEPGGEKEFESPDLYRVLQKYEKEGKE